MQSDWRTMLVGDVTINFDGLRVPLKESSRRVGPYPYYGASGKIDHIDRYSYDGDYLLIAEDGENLRSRKLPVAFMAEGKFWVNNHAHVVQGKDCIRTRYLCYALQIADIGAYTTGSTMPKLTQGNLNRVPVSVPSLAEQDAVIVVLHALEKRIASLTVQIALLESIASKLYKSWFVDFDPVRAKAEGREPEGMNAATAALFPSSLNETSRLPAEWQLRFLGTIADVRIGKTPPRKEPKWFTRDPQDVVWVSIRDMGSAGTYVSSSSEYLTSDAVSQFRVRRIPDDTLLISFKLTVGRLAITDGELTTNEAIAHCLLPPDSGLSSQYLYLYMSHFDFNSLGSTSSIAEAVNSDSIRRIPTLVPSRPVAQAFSEVVRPLFLQMRSNKQRISTLTQLRNTLLPRLISGQLAIPAMEQLIGNAL